MGEFCALLFVVLLLKVCRVDCTCCYFLLSKSVNTEEEKRNAKNDEMNGNIVVTYLNVPKKKEQNE